MTHTELSQNSVPLLPARVEGAVRVGALTLAVGACVGVFLLAAALTWYAHPQTDDMFRVTQARQFGFWGSTAKYYLEWGGRWLGFLGGGVIAEWFDLDGNYPPLLLGPLLFLAGSIAAMARHAAGLPWRWAALVGVAVPAVTFARAAEPGDFFYWFTGAWENQVGTALPLLGFALLLRGGRIGVFLALLCFAVTAAFHELYGLFAVVALVPAAACALTARREDRWWWLLALGLALASFAVSVAAPGNGARADHMDHAWSPGVAAKLTVEQLLDLGRLWMADVVTLSALAVVACCGLKRPDWSKLPVARIVGRQLRWELVLPVLTLSLVVGAVASHAYATGVAMPGRTRCALAVTFTVGALLSAVVLSAGRVPRLAGAQALGAAVLSVGILLAPNVEMGVRDLRTNAPLYDQVMRQRLDLLRAAADGNGHAVLPPLPVMPAVYWDQSVTSDPRDYRNYHTTNYYRLKSVQVLGQPPDAQTR